MSTCINWLTNFLGNSRGIGAENGPFCSFFLRTSRAFISDEKLLFFSCFLHGSMLKVKFSSLLYSFRASRFNDYAVKSDRTSRRKKNLLKHFFLEDGSGFCRSSVQVVKVRFLNFFSPEKTQLLTRAKISCHPKNDGYVILKDLHKKD